jgi:hypothetical protein
VVCLERATAANTDLTDVAHTTILAESLDMTDNLTPNMVKVVLFDIITSMIPRHALAKVKHYLQRRFHKPVDTTVCEYFQCLASVHQHSGTTTAFTIWSQPVIHGRELD